jgi:hypothetical protein
MVTESTIAGCASKVFLPDWALNRPAGKRASLPVDHSR